MFGSNVKTFDEIVVMKENGDYTKGFDDIDGAVAVFGVERLLLYFVLEDQIVRRICISL